MFLLWLVRDHRVVHALFAAGGFLLALWFLDRLGGILLSLFVGYFMRILGLLIAVPTTALIMTVYEAYRGSWNMEMIGRERTTSTVASRLREWREEQKQSRISKDE